MLWSCSEWRIFAWGWMFVCCTEYDPAEETIPGCRRMDNPDLMSLSLSLTYTAICCCLLDWRCRSVNLTRIPWQVGRVRAVGGRTSINVHFISSRGAESSRDDSKICSNGRIWITSLTINPLSFPISFHISREHDRRYQKLLRFNLAASLPSTYRL